MEQCKLVADDEDLATSAAWRNKRPPTHGLLLTCSAATWRVARDDSGEAQATEIQSELVVVILADQFRVHFGDAVDGARSLDLRNKI